MTKDKKEKKYKNIFYEITADIIVKANFNYDILNYIDISLKQTDMISDAAVSLADDIKKIIKKKNRREVSNKYEKFAKKIYTPPFSVTCICVFIMN